MKILRMMFLIIFVAFFFCGKSSVYAQKDSLIPIGYNAGSALNEKELSEIKKYPYTVLYFCKQVDQNCFLKLSKTLSKNSLEKSPYLFYFIYQSNPMAIDFSQFQNIGVRIIEDQHLIYINRWPEFKNTATFLIDANLTVISGQLDLVGSETVYRILSMGSDKTYIKHKERAVEFFSFKEAIHPKIYFKKTSNPLEISLFLEFPFSLKKYIFSPPKLKYPESSLKLVKVSSASKSLKDTQKTFEEQLVYSYQFDASKNYGSWLIGLKEWKVKYQDILYSFDSIEPIEISRTPTSSGMDGVFIYFLPLFIVVFLLFKKLARRKN